MCAQLLILAKLVQTRLVFQLRTKHVQLICSFLAKTELSAFAAGHAPFKHWIAAALRPRLLQKPPHTLNVPTLLAWRTNLHCKHRFRSGKVELPLVCLPTVKSLFIWHQQKSWHRHHCQAHTHTQAHSRWATGVACHNEIRFICLPKIGLQLSCNYATTKCGCCQCLWDEWKVDGGRGVLGVDQFCRFRRHFHAFRPQTPFPHYRCPSFSHLFFMLLRLATSFEIRILH